jgi:hypothetical protein
VTAHRFPDGVAVGPLLDITEDTGLLVTQDPTTGLLVAQTVHREILQEMVGATTGPAAAGTRGAVPTPAIGDHNKILRGDGTWGNVPAGSGPPKVFADAAEAVASTSTTSTTFVDMADMSITLSTAGVDVRVMAFFSATAQVSKVNRVTSFQIVENGAAIADSLREIQIPSTGAATYVACQGTADASDGEIIKVQYKRDAGVSMTITILERSLIVYGVPLTEIA